MASEQSNRFLTLLRRELQEYRTSLVWTPVFVAGALVLFMLASVLLSDRITLLGDAMMKVVMQEESVSGLSIRINIDDDAETADLTSVLAEGTTPDGAPASGNPGWQIEELPDPVDEQEWDFSRDWNFSPKQKIDSGNGEPDTVQSFNVVLSILHNLLMLVLFLVSFNYLLGSLFNDRKDRSILFWKSMPVAEWQEVLSKLTVALLVAPVIYIAVSLLLQLAYMGLGALLVYRLDHSPSDVLFSKIEFAPLVLGQVGGWMLTALWVAPLYAWLLFASAASRRSPFLFAVAPPLAILVLERLFFGSSLFGNLILNHIPHNSNGVDAMGFYFQGPAWSQQNWWALIAGLAAAGGLIAATIYFRRYRFEL